jgi:hypothetical protein
VWRKTPKEKRSERGVQFFGTKHFCEVRPLESTTKRKERTCIEEAYTVKKLRFKEVKKNDLKRPSQTQKNNSSNYADPTIKPRSGFYISFIIKYYLH